MQKNSYVTRVNINKAYLWRNNASLLGGLDIELTERCNNNCVHCRINLPADDVNAKKRELSTGQIKSIIREASSLGCSRVRFTGGEPLLREDFEELYVFARKLGLTVLIFSNATLLTPRLSKLFSRILPLEKIEITVYGMKRSSYEAATRVDGSFEAAWRGINLLLDHKIPFMAKGAFLPSNKDEIEEFEQWTQTIPWTNNKPSYAIFFDLRYRRDDNKNKLIKNLRPSPAEGLQFFLRSKDRYIKEMKQFCSKFMRPSENKLFSCGAGKGSGCVDAYGYFQLCMNLKHPDFGYDLKRGSLKDALVNFFPTLRETKTANPEYLRRCARCFLKGLCEQCPAKSWLEHGTLDTPVEYLCEVAHAQARFLKLIKDNEMAWEVEDWRGRVEKFTKRRYHETKS